MSLHAPYRPQTARASVKCRPGPDQAKTGRSTRGLVVSRILLVGGVLGAERESAGAWSESGAAVGVGQPGRRAERLVQRDPCEASRSERR
jgi:hypothetical protein